MKKRIFISNIKYLTITFNLIFKLHILSFELKIQNSNNRTKYYYIRDI